jgi:indole-3-glycerol phosphate synthase
MKLEPKIIGINNRNLVTFATNISVTIELMRYIPDDIVVVSESGIDSGSQSFVLSNAGVRALLVGESLVRATDIGALARELRMAAE